MVDEWLTLDEALEEIMRERNCPRAIADALLQEWSATYDLLCNYFVTDPPSPRFNAALLRHLLAQPTISVKGPKAKRRNKGSPTRDRAVTAFEALFPNGVPDQSVLPNANLCKQVGEWLKKASLLDVKDDTILRAAGRRK